MTISIFSDCTVDDLGQIFDLLSAWKSKSKNAPRDLKFSHNDYDSSFLKKPEAVGMALR